VPKSNYAFVGMLIALALLAGVLFLAITPFGAALPGGDTMNYYGTSRSLAQGRGFLEFSGEPFVRWPPLYPAVLALPPLLGIRPLDGVRLVNLLAYSLTVLAAGILFARCLSSRILALLGTIAVLCAWPLVLDTYLSFSEPLFTLLMTLFTLCLMAYRNTPTRRLLILLAALAALAALQRYIGIAVIAAGVLGIVLLARDLPLSTRLRHAAVFAVVSAAPLGLWLLRNYALVGELTGGGWDFKAHAIQSAPDYFVSWLWPEAGVKITADPGLGAFLAVGSISLMGLCAVVLSCWQRNGKLTPQLLATTPPVPAALLITVYMATFAYLAEHIYVHVNDRTLAPVAVFFLLLLFAIADGLNGLLNQWKRYAGVGMIALMALFLVRPVNRLAREVNLLSTYDGAMIYNNRAWQQSRLMAWLRSNPMQGNLYSNARYSVAIQTDLYPHQAPETVDDWEDETLDPDQPTYLIWFRDVGEFDCDDSVPSCYNTDYDMAALLAKFNLEPLVEMDEGGVYVLRARE
jgi:4-amino-4-deoxy-L-arabinose transferase-like glycosyltransferase